MKLIHWIVGGFVVLIGFVVFGISSRKRQPKKSGNMKLPKYPKGLKATIAKLETKKKQKAKVAARKKEIEALKKRREKLRNELRK